mmetsp:Transcript_21533/g.53138  ORF Transcript_21533/g.53138 Transcript_21533/m.53138 type:complete len:270 (+) Transcript_21533:309-1118(+)
MASCSVSSLGPCDFSSFGVLLASISACRFRKSSKILLTFSLPVCVIVSHSFTSCSEIPKSKLGSLALPSSSSVVPGIPVINCPVKARCTRVQSGSTRSHAMMDNSRLLTCTSCALSHGGIWHGRIELRTLATTTTTSSTFGCGRTWSVAVSRPWVKESRAADMNSYEYSQFFSKLRASSVAMYSLQKSFEYLTAVATTLGTMYTWNHLHRHDSLSLCFRTSSSDSSSSSEAPSSTKREEILPMQDSWSPFPRLLEGSEIPDLFRLSAKM